MKHEAHSSVTQLQPVPCALRAGASLSLPSIAMLLCADPSFLQAYHLSQRDLLPAMGRLWALLALAAATAAQPMASDADMLDRLRTLMSDPQSNWTVPTCFFPNGSYWYTSVRVTAGRAREPGGCCATPRGHPSERCLMGCEHLRITCRRAGGGHRECGYRDSCGGRVANASVLAAQNATPARLPGCGYDQVVCKNGGYVLENTCCPAAICGTGAGRIARPTSCSSASGRNWPWAHARRGTGQLPDAQPQRHE
jgi:hypothetical protein